MLIVLDIEVKSIFVNQSDLEDILEKNFSLSRQDVDVLYNSKINFTAVSCMTKCKHEPALSHTATHVSSINILVDLHVLLIYHIFFLYVNFS